jgi:hypothetical protein
MKHFKYISLILSILVIVSVSCKKEDINVNYKSKNGSNSDAAVASLQNLSTADAYLEVIILPSTVDQSIRSVFKWYTKLDAPNGKPIHILAQNYWTVEKVAYVRSVLEHYLTDAPELKYGLKAEVANRMANDNAAMTMYNTKASESSVVGQDLQANETVNVGSKEYIENSLRNAALEEVIHFVHDFGLSKVYPEFQSSLEEATTYAISNQIFTAWMALPVADYDNEYWAALNDAYWGAMEYFGEDLTYQTFSSQYSTPYLFLSREACEAGDIRGVSLMKEFLPQYWNSTIQVSASFSGTFYLTKNQEHHYTSQSQYYKDVMLLGDNNSNLYGNTLENTLTGNSGDNELKGGAANDILYGAEGTDIAVYQGSSSEYSISKNGDSYIVTDQIQERDGTDHLFEIEKLKFLDVVVDLTFSDAI